MITNLGWEPLQNRRKVARLTMLQKIRQGQVAIPAQTFLQPATSRRSSRLNHNQCYTKPTGRTDYFLQSFFPLTINDWNSLPEHIVTINQINEFKIAVTNNIKATTAPSNQQHSK